MFSSRIIHPLPRSALWAFPGCLYPFDAFCRAFAFSPPSRPFVSRILLETNVLDAIRNGSFMAQNGSRCLKGAVGSPMTATRREASWSAVAERQEQSFASATPLSPETARLRIRGKPRESLPRSDSFMTGIPRPQRAVWRPARGTSHRTPGRSATAVLIPLPRPPVRFSPPPSPETSDPGAAPSFH